MEHNEFVKSIESEIDEHPEWDKFEEIQGRLEELLTELLKELTEEEIEQMKDYYRRGSVVRVFIEIEIP